MHISPNLQQQSFGFPAASQHIGRGLQQMPNQANWGGNQPFADQTNFSQEANGQGPGQRNLKIEAQLQVMMLSMMSPDQQDAHIDALEQDDPQLAKAVMELLEGGGAEAQQMGQHHAPAEHAPAAEHAPEHAAAPAEAHGAAEAGAGTEKGPEIGLPDAPAGFLWKPKSENDGKLVMLLPKGMEAKSIDIMSPDGKKKLSSVSRGGDQGKVANGGREHYRFGKSGSAYPPNSKVRIKMKNGATRDIKIPKPSIRNAGTGKK